MNKLKISSASSIAIHLRVCPHLPLNEEQHNELFHQSPQAGISVVTSKYGLDFVQRHAQAIHTCKNEAIAWYFKYQMTNKIDGYGVIKATKTRLSLYRLPV